MAVGDNDQDTAGRVFAVTPDHLRNRLFGRGRIMAVAGGQPQDRYLDG